MRTLLYSQRPALESLLHTIESATRHSATRRTTPAHLEHWESLQRKLLQFAYIEPLALVTNEERALRDRYRSARDGLREKICDTHAQETFAASGRRAQYSCGAIARLVSDALDEAIRQPHRAMAALEEAARKLEHIEHERALQPRDALAQLARTIIERTGQARTVLVHATVSEISHRFATERQTGRRDERPHDGHATSIEQRLLAIRARAESLLEYTRRTPQVPERFIDVQHVLFSASNLSIDTLERNLHQYGSIIRFKYGPYLALRTDSKTAAELAERPQSLFQHRTGSRIEAWHERLYSVTPYKSNKGYGDGSWNLEMLDVRDAWRKTKGKGARVAVIDTGIDYEHKELAGRFESVRGIDFVENKDPLDQNGHGTHVAGTIAGRTVGVAPSATLYAVRVLDADGMGSEVAVLQGMEWAIDQNVAVMSMSLGSSYESRAEAHLVKTATERGIAVVCAAGNDGDTSYNYPASCPGAISIAAVNREKDHAWFSNSNDRVAIAAPGVNIFSLAPDGSYATLSGTSMATPHVSGVCALLHAAGVKGASAMRERMETSAEPLGEAEEYGAGLVSAGRAVNG